MGTAPVRVNGEERVSRHERHNLHREDLAKVQRKASLLRLARACGRFFELVTTRTVSGQGGCDLSGSEELKITYCVE